MESLAYSMFYKLAAWFCDPCLRHIPITTFVLSTPPGILCTRIPLCHKFHELVDCIKTKLKIVTSMQFKLCTASWLEWGGGTQYKSVYRGVPQTWVAKSRWSGLSGPFSLQNLVPKITESVPKEHKCSQKLWYLYWVKIWAIGIWMGPLLMGGTKIPCSTSLSRPNLSSQANPSCYQAFHKLVKIQESCTASILFS